MNDAFDERGRRQAIFIDVRWNEGGHRQLRDLEDSWRHGGNRVEHDYRAVIIVERSTRMRRRGGMRPQVHVHMAMALRMMVPGCCRLMHMLRRRDRNEPDRERQHDSVRTPEHCN